MYINILFLQQIITKTKRENQRVTVEQYIVESTRSKMEKTEDLLELEEIKREHRRATRRGRQQIKVQKSETS